MKTAPWQVRFIALAMAIVAAGSAHADTVALTFTGGSTVTLSKTLGWEFTTSTALTISSLGWWDAGGNGLTNTHQVAIWNTGGTELLSATVASGTTDPLQSGFRFDSNMTGSTRLAAGTYIIAGLASTGDPTADRVPAGNLTLIPGVTYVQDEFASFSMTFQFPDDTQIALGTAFFGPNFTIPSTAPVPEPSTFALLGTSALGLFAAAQRKLTRPVIKA